MTTPNGSSPRSVLLAAIDLSPIADRVIAQAASLARAMPGCEIHLLYVLDPAEGADVSNDTRDVLLGQRREYIDRRAREVQAASGGIVVGHLSEGRPWSVIVQTAASLDADLVVVGTGDRHGVERWLMGSVAMKVVERTACPVVVVRAKDHHTAHAPEIEPPCPQCLEVQRTSRGAQMWCARHAQHHPRAHVHYESSDGFGAGSSLIRPEDRT